MESIANGLDHAEERISEIGDKVKEVLHSEQKTKNKNL
jgi:hypothetical protein